MSNYSYGVTTILQLMGKLEDVSRFDYVFATVKDEASYETIHQRITETPEPFFPPQRKVAPLFCGVGRGKPSQIVFTDECVDYILNIAVRYLVKKYVAAIPLIQVENARFKLARIAASLAGRLYSTDATFERLIVTKAHAEYAVKILESFYDNPALDYKGYSDAYRYQNEITDTAQVEQAFRTLCLSNMDDVIKNFLYSDSIYPNQIADWLGTDSQNVFLLTSRLIQTRILKSVAKGYRKTPAGIKYLRKLLMDKKWRKKKNGAEQEPSLY